MIKNFRTSPPPHLRIQDSVSGITWRFFAAAVPAFLILLIQHPLERLRMLALVFMTAAALETALARLQKKKWNFKDGSTVLWAFLLLLILPPGAGTGMILCASAVMVCGKEFYGGRSSLWAHPVWLAYAFLTVSFPQNLSGPFSFWNPFTGLWPALTTLVLLCGGLFLIIKKNTSWEVPALYLALVLVLSQLTGHTELSLPLVLLSAFWILPDPGSAPCSRRARMYGALIAALMTVVSGLLSVPAAPVFAVLTLNLLTPWLDEWVLPQGIAFEARVQGARSRS